MTDPISRRLVLGAAAGASALIAGRSAQSAPGGEPDALFGRVTSSGYSYHESRWLRAMGTQGWAELNPALSFQGLEMRVGRRLASANAVDARRFGERSQFALEMDHFAKAIRADRTPRTPGQEGFQDLRIIEVIYQAAESGGSVKLATIEGRDTRRGPAPSEAG